MWSTLNFFRAWWPQANLCLYSGLLLQEQVSYKPEEVASPSMTCYEMHTHHFHFPLLVEMVKNTYPLLRKEDTDPFLTWEECHSNLIRKVCGMRDVIANIFLFFSYFLYTIYHTMPSLEQPQMP
jgi:hypothetical protein